MPPRLKQHARVSAKHQRPQYTAVIDEIHDPPLSYWLNRAGLSLHPAQLKIAERLLWVQPKEAS